MQALKAKKKSEPEKVVQAQKSDKKWKVTHPDGHSTVISEHKFQKRYEIIQ